MSSLLALPLEAALPSLPLLPLPLEVALPPLPLLTLPLEAALPSLPLLSCCWNTARPSLGSTLSNLLVSIFTCHSPTLLQAALPSAQVPFLALAAAALCRC